MYMDLVLEQYMTLKMIALWGTSPAITLLRRYSILRWNELETQFIISHTDYDHQEAKIISVWILNVEVNCSREKISQFVVCLILNG